MVNNMYLVYLFLRFNLKTKCERPNYDYKLKSQHYKNILNFHSQAKQNNKDQI